MSAATIFALVFLGVLPVKCMAQGEEAPHVPAKGAQATSLAGCYELVVGRWWPRAFGEDTKYVTPPKMVELSLEVGTEEFEKDHLIIRTIPRKNRIPGEREAAFWDAKAENEIHLAWTDGFTGVTLLLENHGNELRGWAHPHFDAAKLIPRIAHVKATRITCHGQ